MPKQPKEFVEGGGGHRLNVDLDEEGFKYLATIREHIKKKYGPSVATNSAATRAALQYYARKIEEGEVE
jgi:hypothetical protein